MKRIYQKTLLLFAFLMTSMIVSAYDCEVDGIYYNLSENEASVTYGKSNSYKGDVVIPSKIKYNNNSYNVTSIGREAFYNCSSLTSVTIPNSVTSIGWSAFGYCSALTSINIPNSVTSIEESAFRDCSGLTTITIPSSVTTIGGAAFQWCSGLTSVTIPNSVTSIENYVFIGCSGLTSISIPNSVTTIGGSAFAGCSGLTSVTIPNSVTSIGGAAFANCSGLTSVIIPSNVTSIEDQTFDGCSGLTSVTIPNSVTSIGFGAFAYCSSLTSVTIPNSVTSIGHGAFANCSGLTSITIPNSVTSIGGSVFKGCSGLTTIIIPSNVTSIEDQTFAGCSGLTSFTIPNCVTSIGHGAFASCSGLTSFTIPNCVTSIGYGAFEGCSGLTSITIPNSVTSIGEEAFRGCSGLTSVTIPNSVTSIGEEAFSGTAWYNKEPDGLVYAGKVAYKYKGLMPEGTSVTLEKGTMGIAGAAFSGCSGLTSVTIPSSVTEVGIRAFAYCAGLTSIVVEKENSKYDSREDCNAIIESATNTLIQGCKTTVIPNSVTSIGGYAFEGCSGLTSITIPNNVTDIGHMAFYGCSNIRIIISKITKPKEFGSWSSPFDSDVTSNAALYVPKGTKSLYKSCYVWKNFKHIIEGDAFLAHTEERVETLFLVANDEDSTCVIGDGERLAVAQETTGTYTIPTNVKGYTVNGISNGALACEGLTDVTIPASVSFIGNGAFHGCKNMTSIVSKIKEPFDVENSAFMIDSTANKALTATLYVPYGTKAKYEATKGWSLFKGRIVEVKDKMLAEDVTMLQGKRTSVNVSLENNEEGIYTAYQFTLLLPDYIGVAQDEDGEYECDLVAERYQGKTHRLTVTEKDTIIADDGSVWRDFQFICYSDKNKLIKGTEGPLLNITLLCDKDVKIKSPKLRYGLITDITFSDENMEGDPLDNVSFKIDLYPTGDVNYDYNVDVKDIVGVVGCINRQIDDEETRTWSAADVNCDGKVNIKDIVNIIDIINQK